MWEKLRVVFSIPELRNKILLTLALLAIYRIGWQISLPIIDSAKVETASSSSDFGKLVEYAAVFSASNLRQATIFGLGIMPYISASIIFQLLGSVWKPIEELQKEIERVKAQMLREEAEKAQLQGDDESQVQADAGVQPRARDLVPVLLRAASSSGTP